MGSPLAVPAPAIQEAVFINVNQEKLERKIGISEKRTDLIQLAEGVERTTSQGRSVPLEKFSGIRIDPDDPFLGRYRIDDPDGILRQKFSELCPHSIHISGLDLCDTSLTIDIRNITADRNFLVVFIGVDIIFEHSMECFFGLHPYAVPFSGLQRDDLCAGGFKPLCCLFRRDFSIRKSICRAYSVYRQRYIPLLFQRAFSAALPEVLTSRDA